MVLIASYFKDSSAMRTVKAGTPVLFQGEVPRQVYIVLQGLVRAYTISSSGDEQIIGLYGKGDVFPLSFAIGDATTALFYYEALSDTHLLEVDFATFEHELTTNQAAARSLLTHIGREYTTLMLRITALGQARTIEKLAHTFYYLQFRYGLTRDDGWFELDIKLTQSMLASLIGQTREGTARNLKTLVQKQIISYKTTQYFVHRDRLLGFLGEDTFRDIGN